MLVERRRLAEDDVADGERDGRRADAGGEREHRDERRHRIAAHVAGGAPQVLDEAIEPEHPAGLVESFPHAGDVAKPAAGRGPGLGRRHAILDQTVGLDLDVRADFPGEVFVRLLSG